MELVVGGLTVHLVIGGVGFGIGFAVEFTRLMDSHAEEVRGFVGGETEADALRILRGELEVFKTITVGKTGGRGTH